MNQKLKFYVIVILQIGFILGLVVIHQVALLSGQKIFLKITPIDPQDLFRGYYAHLNYDISTISTHGIKVDKEDFRRGEYIYAVLVKDSKEKFYRVAAISHKKPRVNSGESIIRGRIVYFCDMIKWKVWVQTEEVKIKEYEDDSYGWCPNFQSDEPVAIYLRKDGNIDNVIRKEKEYTPHQGQKVEYGKVVRFEKGKGMKLDIKYGIESYFAEKTKTTFIERSGREDNLYAEISLEKNGRALISRIFLNDKPL